MGLGQGYCACRSVFYLFYWDLLVGSIVFCAKLHFQTLWPFQALCLDLDRLVGPSLVHGSSHGKGHPKLAWAGFWCRQDAGQHGQDASQHGQDASQHGQDASWHGQDVNRHQVRTKLAWAGPQSCLARFLEASARQR